jgi:large repetitive protein
MRHAACWRRTTAFGAGAGFVSYTVEARSPDEVKVTDQTPENQRPDGIVKAGARVLFDTQAPEDTLVLEQRVDAVAPATQLEVERIAGTDSYTLRWDSGDARGGSGFKHVTLYVAVDGGDFKIWQRRLEQASGELLFDGQAGKQYEFLALATDLAGNRERPTPGVNAQADGGDANLGALPQVPGTTPPNFGQPPPPVDLPSTSEVFAEAQAGIPNVTPPTRPSEFETVLRPFVGGLFADGFDISHAGIGPMAIAEAPDGSILVAGGANRGEVWRFSRDGGSAAEAQPWARFEEPIFNMAFDDDGRLWATTGGGALLRIDADTGTVAARYGSGITIALAVEPERGRIFVSTNAGVSVFDPLTGQFEQWSRDENLRVGSLAFDNQGNLWAVTWPDRRQVVKFTAFRRAELMLQFDSDLDSIAFGRNGTYLEDLLFVSHNAGRIDSTGAASPESELTMVDVATLKRIAVAQGGTRGDVVFTTSDGRVLISQSDQVDVLAPAVAPRVVTTSPADGGTLPLPLPFITVVFDQDMSVGDAAHPGSVLNLDNYKLVGDAVGAVTLQGLRYDAATRSVLLVTGALKPDRYTLTIEDSLQSVLGQRLSTDHVVRFDAINDLSALLDVQFGMTRYDRATGTLSYDVTLRNKGDVAVTLPAVMLLDPRDGYEGVPQGVQGRTDDGRWLIDLSANLPPGGRLLPGQATAGRTIAVATPERRRVDFATGVLGASELNSAPQFDSEPVVEATVGEAWSYQALASDPDGHPVFYVLLSGPEGMQVDVNTGLATWTPGAQAPAEQAVTIGVFDARGALALQRFLIDVEQGNRPPRFVSAPSLVEGREGEAIVFSVLVDDEDGDALTLWADNLPPGASFDAVSRSFAWTPAFDRAGTYTDVRIYASDGKDTAFVSFSLLVSPGYRLPELVKPAERIVAEGDRLKLQLIGRGDTAAELRYSSTALPFGATLHPITGLLEWTPLYTQAGDYVVPLTVDDGLYSYTSDVSIRVVNANAAPVFDPFDGWQIYENQPLWIKTYAWDADNPFYEPAERDVNGALVLTSDLQRTVTVSASGLPEGATFDAETWDLRWTPTHLQAGTYTVTLTAVDDGDGTGRPATTVTTVPITVLNINRAPAVVPIDNVVIQRGATGQFTIGSEDAENNTRSLVALSEMPGFPLPSFMSFVDNGDGTGRFSMAPGAGDRGDHAIKVIVTDDGDGNPDEKRSSEYVFIVSVQSLNEPPKLRHLGDVVAIPGKQLQLPVLVADLDQDALTYSLSGLPPGATLEPSAVYGVAMLRWTPTAADLGPHDVQVTVRDSGNGNATLAEQVVASFRVVVRNTNNTPLLLPVGDQQVAEGGLLQFQLRGVDLDGDPLSYRAVDLPSRCHARWRQRRVQLAPRAEPCRQLHRHAGRHRRRCLQRRDHPHRRGQHQPAAGVRAADHAAGARRRRVELQRRASAMPTPTRSSWPPPPACRPARCSCPAAASSSGRPATTRPASTWSRSPQSTRRASPSTTT